MSEGEYVANKRANRFYISGEIAGKGKYVSRVTDPGVALQFVQVENELEIRLTPRGKQQIKAFVLVDDRSIRTLTLQRFDGDLRSPNEVMHFSLVGPEINALLEFASVINSPTFEGSEKIRVDVRDLQHYNLTPEALRKALQSDPKLIQEAATETVTDRDVIALAYRKHALKEFSELLENSAFFNAKVMNSHGPEAVWQDFFERNTWIFGYGLFFVFATNLDGRKLEAMVAGSSVAQNGKRADALLKTRGSMSALCFAEIKHHETQLLASQEYRPGVWAPSRELVGAVAQIQKTVDAAEEELGKQFEPTNHGEPTGEKLFMARPRSIVVAGRLSEFVGENGPNAAKFRQFELYRRQVLAPEILTFDELYERARFIVDSSFA